MNDFLYNLASRAVSVDDDVRPRLPSLFEPGASVSAPGFALSDEASDVQFQKIAPDRAPSDGPTALDLSLPQSVNADEGFRASEQTDSQPMTTRLVSAEERHVESDRHYLASPSKEDAADMTVGNLSPTTRSTPLRPASLSPADRDEKLLSVDLAPKLIPEPPHATSPESDNAIRNNKSQFAETIERNEFSRGTRQRSLVAAKTVDRIRSGSDVNNETILVSNAAPNQPVLNAKHGRSDWQLQRPRITSEPPISENVINVTIGRIEVRAASPPPAKSRSGNQVPPVMSLDDYLRQRTRSDRGGGR